jgi:hypothetical protein
MLAQTHFGRWVVLDVTGWGDWRVVKHDASGLAIVRHEPGSAQPDCYRKHVCSGRAA